MSEPRNWLCLITSNKEHENIDELTRDIWQHFDGICAVVHRQGGLVNTRRILEERKGAGFVLERDWTWHHGHSMNHFLFDQRIRAMDALWLRDSTERFHPAFAEQIRGFSEDCLKQGIWNLAQWSKVLMFRRWYGQQVVNGLHWGVSGLNGPTVAMERFPQFANDRDYAYSVRKDRRPADHRYLHELRYLIDYGLNGNHLALFHRDAESLDAAQWSLYHYTEWLHGYGIETAADLIARWTEIPLDNEHKTRINVSRPIRNAYRYFVLKHTDADIQLDEDTWRLL